jgi:hypothetical protein
LLCYLANIDKYHANCTLRCVLLALSFFLCVPVGKLHAAQSVSLAWDPASDPGVIGYRVHCGTTSRVYTQQIEVGNTTAVVISNLAEGKTYFFAVTAYNQAYRESSPSNEVRYTVPLPPPIAIAAASTQSLIAKISVTAVPTAISQGQVARYTIKALRLKANVPVTVHYVMRGSAVLGADYTLSGWPGQVTFLPGRSSVTIRLTALKTHRSNGSKLATMFITPGPGYTIVPMGYKAPVVINSP